MIRSENGGVFRAAHYKEDDEQYCLQEDAKLNAYLDRFGLEGSDELEAVIPTYFISRGEQNLCG